MRKVREYEKYVVLDDGNIIPINDIFAIDGTQFDEKESICEFECS